MGIPSRHRARRRRLHPHVFRGRGRAPALGRGGPRVLKTSRPGYRFVDVGLDGPGDLLALSPVLPEALAVTAARGEPVVLLRRQEPYVLLGPRDRRLPAFAEGVRHLARRGYPVFMRIGGGSCVYLDRSCLSFAVARPCRDLTLTDANFRELADGAVRGLRRLGLAARFGAAPGSFCEGPFDIVTGDPPRKIAGVAQAIRGGFALVSGMVLVSQDPVAATSIVQDFYHAAGDGRRLDPNAVTSLVAELGRDVDVEEVARALRDGFAEMWTLREDAVREEELERAETLRAARRLA